jgi:integrase
MTEDKPRRPKGSGSIYTRKDGRVVGEYEANGKKRYVYGKTKKDVAAKLAKAIADRDAGLVYDSEKLTVGAYLDKWLEEYTIGTDHMLHSFVSFDPAGP